MIGRLLLAFFLLAGLVTSCGRQQAWTDQDSWYTGPPSREEPYWSSPELDRSRVHEVLESREAEAEALLQDVPATALTDGQAADLIGQPLPDVPGTTPYLVRGLYLNRGTGQFLVYVSGERLTVHHASMGSRTVPMKRQALVLQLEQSPEEVFVFCSMAE